MNIARRIDPDPIDPLRTEIGQHFPDHGHQSAGPWGVGRFDDQRAELSACAIVDQKVRRTVGLDTDRSTTAIARVQ
jgi:hypothetical protein